MDKYEYRIKAQEIDTLITKGKYAEAAEIADSIDWRRVKSVMMLCKISDLYKINRRFEESRDLLLLAYDRHPGGRSIVYSLCELSIKMGDLLEAVEYYKEFVQVAPQDSGRYVLRYKLYEAQEVSLEERIAVLEEFKAVDYVGYTEKWAYELAYLYHRVGLGTRCVEECDELILCCGGGKYVLKAMELKMLHEPLTPDQQEKYEIEKGISPNGIVEQSHQEAERREADVMDAPTVEIPSDELDIEVKVMGLSQYDTINIQKELADNMKELWGDTDAAAESGAEGMAAGDDQAATEESEKAQFQGTEEPDPQATKVIADVKEVLAKAGEAEAAISEQPADPQQSAEPVPSAVPAQETKVEEVFFGETADMDEIAQQVSTQPDIIETEDQEEPAKEEKKPAPAPAFRDIPKGFEKILGMDYDGQISLLLPESEQIEKQITGQIRLDDVLLEWERVKKENEQKRLEAVRQRVLEQTGSMFTEFEASMRDGLLEQLESGKIHEVPAELSGEEEVAAQEDRLEEVEADTEAVEAVETESAEVVFDDTDEVEEIEEVKETDWEEQTESEALEEAAEAEEGVAGQKAEQPEETLVEAEKSEAGEEDQESEEPEKAEEADKAQESGKTQEPEEPEKAEEAYQEEVKKEQAPREKKKHRQFSPEEEELFGAFAHSASSREQIFHAIDNISMASYTGNVIITGNENMDAMTLAKNLVKEIKNTDNNFSGKIAKISAASLNKKDLAKTLDQLTGGALIIQKTSELNKETTEKLYKILDQEGRGIIVLLLDTKKAMNKFLEENRELEHIFNIRVDVEALSNDALVACGKKYAREQEHSIDELGVLALHTTIADRQTSDHAVTIAEVQEIIDDAIRRANRKTLGHFFDILVARRYDEEDMIILREKDFV